MVKDILVKLKTISIMEKERIYFQMEISISGILKMVNNMDMVSLPFPMGTNISVISKRIV